MSQAFPSWPCALRPLQTGAVRKLMLPLYVILLPCKRTVGIYLSPKLPATLPINLSQAHPVFCACRCLEPFTMKKSTRFPDMHSLLVGKTIYRPLPTQASCKPGQPALVWYAFLPRSWPCCLCVRTRISSGTICYPVLEVCSPLVCQGVAWPYPVMDASLLAIVLGVGDDHVRVRETHYSLQMQHNSPRMLVFCVLHVLEL